MVCDADSVTARRSVLLADMPESIVEKLMSMSSVVSFNRGELVFLQGDRAVCIYIVLSGWVKLFRINPRGAEAIVDMFTTGQSFGEAVALCGADFPVSAEAATNARLLQIGSGDFLKMMTSQPELCFATLAATSKRLRALVTQIEQLKAHSGAQRIAEFLLDLCPVDEGACAVRLPYDKVLISGQLGMKPESLSRAFAGLNKVGVKIVQNHASISDVARLRAYVEQDRATSWSQGA